MEVLLHTASELFVTLTETEKSVVLRMSTVCTADLSELSFAGFTVDSDGENEWTVEYSVPKSAEGGERI